MRWYAVNVAFAKSCGHTRRRIVVKLWMYATFILAVSRLFFSLPLMHRSELPRPRGPRNATRACAKLTEPFEFKVYGRVQMSALKWVERLLEPSVDETQLIEAVSVSIIQCSSLTCCAVICRHKCFYLAITLM